MADGRTARPGHVTRERALCASPAPCTAIFFFSLLPPRTRLLPPFYSCLARAAPHSVGAFKRNRKWRSAKTAARGPSRTRSAVSNVRLEVPLPLPPPFGRFLESAHPPTPQTPAAGGDGASGWDVVAPPGRKLCPVRRRRRDGGGKARTRRLLMS